MELDTMERSGYCTAFKAYPLHQGKKEGMVSQTQLTQPALGGSSRSTMLLDIQDGSLSTVQSVLGGRDWGILGVCRAESLMEMATSMFSE